MNISDFKNKHSGETCVIIGNGPSLNETDMEKVAKFITFGTNRIYKKFVPDYFVCVNDLVIDQFGQEIMSEFADIPKFIKKAKLYDGWNEYSTIPLDTSLNYPHFETDLTMPIWEGHTVTYVCMQLARYMGFECVILVGVDHYFNTQGTPNMEVTSAYDDKDHFDPDYFGPGVKWNLPDLAKSEIAYSLAKLAFEPYGGIVNCSARTALKTFKLSPFQKVAKFPQDHTVSAIVSAYYTDASPDKTGYDATYLEGCLADLEKQTMPVEKVVVYQQGSPEAQIIEQHKDDQTYVLVKTEDVPTIYKAWNLGIKAASGRYLTNANVDDQHSPDAFRMMVQILDANDHIDLVYANVYITWKYEPYDVFVKRVSKTGMVGDRVEGKDGIFQWHPYDPATLVVGCYIGPQPMWRANLHQRYGLFDPEFESAGDYEFWLRVREEGNMFHIPEPLGLYLARPDGKELSDLELSRRETGLAHGKNMQPGMTIQPYSRELSIVQLGKEFTLVEPAAFMRLLDKQNREETDA